MINWNKIENILLDMDGTLIDSYHEDHFWEFLIPQEYAKIHNIPIERAISKLKAKYAPTKGTLLWSDMQHWSNETGINLWKLRDESKNILQAHPHTIKFLEFLKKEKKKIFLVTAAPLDDVEFKIGHTEIKKYFDGIYSQIEMKIPKEKIIFWKELQKLIGYNPDTTLLAEDNEEILAAARASGIKHLVFKMTRNSQKPPKELMQLKDPNITTIHHFDEIIPRDKI
ncbi:MAG: HAD family hydrolase [Candidatus Aenigmatarchaeota archaeon]